MNYGKALRLTGPFASAYLAISSFYKGNEFESSIPCLTSPPQITTLKYASINAAITQFKIVERVTNQITRCITSLNASQKKM